ncbi:MAG: YebC/PmpR family DNA-binding transcriptional regulator [bacterium]|nr:YebC/PmpR family DNA-binding transcriptional regulator [bacterium]
MSGHSKWSQIKNKKNVTDQKRGQVFSKLLRAISIAAKQEPNPDFNPRLRSTIQKAKDSNVPNENIQRAISKAAETKDLEELALEAYGPEATPIIIEVVTDNRNRTINELRILLSANNAKLADQGSVLWAFEKVDGEWHAKFPQPASEETKQKIESLKNALEAHDDVQKVIPNTG